MNNCVNITLTKIEENDHKIMLMTALTISILIFEKMTERKKTLDVSQNYPNNKSVKAFWNSGNIPSSRAVKWHP